MGDRPVSEEPDYDELDPGIRETVRWLRAMGFDTCDSGDGKSLDYAHVFIQVRPPMGLESECKRLHFLLTQAGCCIEPVGHSKIWIEGTYDPSDGSAIIALIGVNDRCGTISARN